MPHATALVAGVAGWQRRLGFINDSPRPQHGDTLTAAGEQLPRFIEDGTPTEITFSEPG